MGRRRSKSADVGADVRGQSRVCDFFPQRLNDRDVAHVSLSDSSDEVKSEASNDDRNGTNHWSDADDEVPAGQPESPLAPAREPPEPTASSFKGPVAKTTPTHEATLNSAGNLHMTTTRVSSGSLPT